MGLANHEEGLRSQWLDQVAVVVVSLGQWFNWKMTSAVLSEMGYSSTGRQKGVLNQELGPSRLWKLPDVSAVVRQRVERAFLYWGHCHFPSPSRHPVEESSGVTERPQGYNC